MKLENIIENYDAIVIGSGHAGSEAALSLARLGKKTLLTTLNLDSFNTTSVKTMACMFNYCESLTELDVTNFNTSQVTDMSYMFGACRVLGVLDLSNFDTSAVTTTEKMFSGCWALTTIYANTDWNTTTLTNSTSMFNACTKLVGAIAHSSSKIDITMANPDTGYFTRKEA